MLDVLVIGAGQAGLASAYHLQKAGLDFLVLEATQRAAGSWPHYYDSLVLFSPAAYSGLPGLPFPGDPERYPRRDEVVGYLEQYARHFAFPIRFGARVQRVTGVDGNFHVMTDAGETWQARTVISASGPFRQPHLPAFEGLDQFTGQVLHSSAYRRPEDVLGQRVAVVGVGNSAIQIAHELSRTRDVTVLGRGRPRFLAQRQWGRDIHFWLRRSGLDQWPLGHWLGWAPATPVLDDGRYRAAFASGKLKYRPMFQRITEQGLVWNEKAQPFDTLLLATGFVNRPAYLEGLDGLSASEAAQQKGGVARHVAGLFFVGNAWQRNNASATLRGVGPDAARVVRRIQSSLNRPASLGFGWACCR